jgi:hypothetical protein
MLTRGCLMESLKEEAKIFNLYLIIIPGFDLRITSWDVVLNKPFTNHFAI